MQTLSQSLETTVLEMKLITHEKQAWEMSPSLLSIQSQTHTLDYYEFI